MNGGLTAGDRFTLRARRAANLVGWSLAALALSLFLRLGFEDGASLVGHSLSEVFDWVGFGEYALVVIVPSSVLCGCLIGSIVGARVDRGPTLVAGVVSAIYAAVVWVAALPVDVPHHAFVRAITAALLPLAIATAAVVGRRVAISRPHARFLGTAE